MGAPDNPVCHRTCTFPCLVRCHVTQLLGFRAGRPLRLCPLAAPDSLVPHRIVQCPSYFATLTSVRYCAALFLLSESPVDADSRCSAGSPDSPVAHRIVR
jgi:hypothetical protein